MGAHMTKGLVPQLCACALGSQPTACVSVGEFVWSGLADLLVVKHRNGDAQAVTSGVLVLALPGMQQVKERRPRTNPLWNAIFNS